MHLADASSIWQRMAVTCGLTTRRGKCGRAASIEHFGTIQHQPRLIHIATSLLLHAHAGAATAAQRLVHGGGLNKQLCELLDLLITHHMVLPFQSSVIIEVLVYKPASLNSQLFSQALTSFNPTVASKWLHLKHHQGWMGLLMIGRIVGSSVSELGGLTRCWFGQALSLLEWHL